MKLADMPMGALRRSCADFASYMKTWTTGMQTLENPKGDRELALAFLKEARDTSKLIRTDPEVGLTAPPQVTVNLEMKPIQKFIDVSVSPEEVFNWDIKDSK